MKFSFVSFRELSQNDGLISSLNLGQLKMKKSGTFSGSGWSIVVGFIPVAK
jgi:hypothetical protein